MCPLPSPRLDAASAPPPSREGFVDDEVVLALVAGKREDRALTDSKDLALAVDEDFAGWYLEMSSFSHPRQVAQSSVEIRRAAAPELEPGLGEPHQGAHRWWIAGFAGALCTLLFSALLFSLSNQAGGDPEGISIIRVPAKTSPSAASEGKETPELTGNPPILQVR